ncbi:MAG: flippase-like domain-containing protein [Ignavibacteria bacterium]|nr:flippase-like domain-containing protein [Ignavibacteria bacterium]
MTKKVKQIIKFLVLFGLLIVFLYLAFRGIDFGKLVAELGKTNYFLAIFAMLIGVVFGSVVRAMRWRYFLYPEKKYVKLKDLFSAVMIGYFTNAIIPRGGEVSRPFVLAQKEGISKAFTLGTIVVERIFDMLSMFFVFGLCLFFYRDKMKNAFGDLNIEAISLYISVAILLFVFFVALMLVRIEKTKKFIEKIAVKILPAKYSARVQEILISLINSFSFIKYPKNYFMIFALTVLLWLTYALSTFIMMKSFHDITLNSLSFFDANLVLTLTAFAQTIPLPGNSAGSFHFFAKTTLVVVFAVTSEVAVAFATVTHLLNFIGVLLIGFFYSVKENYKFSLKLSDFKSSGNNKPDTDSESNIGLDK